MLDFANTPIFVKKISLLLMRTCQSDSDLERERETERERERERGRERVRESFNAIQS